MTPIHHGQRGFSLVELMVAMVLGLLITGAAVSLFSTNQRTFQLQQAKSQLQEQGQLAMRFIVDDVRMAGFRDQSVASDEPAILASAVAGLTLPIAADNDSNGNDRLTLSRHARRDCEGNPAPGAGIEPEDMPYLDVVNTYWVDNDGDLKCQGNQAASATGGVALLSGVASFQVLYGIDTNPGDGIAFAGRYVTADQIGTDDVVLAVKLSVLLKADASTLGAGDEQDYYLLDEDVTVDTDRALFRQFSATVALRNYSWEKI